jgi:hypothetical protein
MNKQHTLWEAVMRCFWIGVAILAALAVLRLCAWADAGLRGEAPIEEHIIP